MTDFDKIFEEADLFVKLLQESGTTDQYLIDNGYDPAEVRRKARALVDVAWASSPLNPKNQFERRV